MADLKRFACVVDGHDDPDPTCVLDHGRPQDCLYAAKGEFKTPEGCEWWQPVRCVRPIEDAKDATIKRMRGLLGHIDKLRVSSARGEISNAEFLRWLKDLRIDAELKEGE